VPVRLWTFSRMLFLFLGGDGLGGGCDGLCWATRAVCHGARQQAQKLFEDV